MSGLIHFEKTSRKDKPENSNFSVRKIPVNYISMFHVRNRSKSELDLKNYFRFKNFKKNLRSFTKDYIIFLFFNHLELSYYFHLFIIIAT